VEAPADEQHQRRSRRPDELGQGDRDAERLVDVESAEDRGEERLGARHAQVRGQREPEPTADGRPVHRSDPGELDGTEPRRGCVEALSRRWRAEEVVTAVAAPAEVGTRAEGSSLGDEHAAATPMSRAPSSNAIATASIMANEK
jgi:hypothetical protein